MAKLSKVKSKKPIPIGVEGIFINNLPVKVLQDLFGDITERLKDDPNTVVVELFTKLICDDNGDAFEDIGSYEDIIAVLSVKDIQDIMAGIAGTMNPSAEDLGK